MTNEELAVAIKQGGADDLKPALWDRVNPRTFHVVAANAFACLAEEHLNTVHQLACKAVFNNGFDASEPHDMPPF